MALSAAAVVRYFRLYLSLSPYHVSTKLVSKRVPVATYTKIWFVGESILLFLHSFHGAYLCRAAQLHGKFKTFYIFKSYYKKNWKGENGLFSSVINFALISHCCTNCAVLYLWWGLILGGQHDTTVLLKEHIFRCPVIKSRPFLSLHYFSSMSNKIIVFQKLISKEIYNGWQAEE